MMPKSRRTSDGFMSRPSSKRPRPEFSVTEKDLPAIKGWKVGDKYTMTIQAEMVSSSKGSSYDSIIGSPGKEELQSRFKILKVEEGSGEKEDYEDEE